MSTLLFLSFSSHSVLSSTYRWFTCCSKINGFSNLCFNVFDCWPVNGYLAMVCKISASAYMCRMCSLSARVAYSMSSSGFWCTILYIDAMHQKFHTHTSRLQTKMCLLFSKHAKSVVFFLCFCFIKFSVQFEFLSVYYLCVCCIEEANASAKSYYEGVKINGLSFSLMAIKYVYHNLRMKKWRNTHNFKCSLCHQYSCSKWTQTAFSLCLYLSLATTHLYITIWNIV